ncbi:MAG: histidine kinase [Flavobacteriales bacterium]|nr:histidine kinase [Flavobacteriales bacterium]
MRAKISTIFILFFSSVCYAQQPLFEQLTTENGLGSNNVYDIEVTPNGEVWVTTDKHLCAFQGLSFSTYEINDSSLTGLFLDSRGMIWVYSSNGNIYDFDGIRLKKIETGTQDKLQIALTNQMVFESRHTFWVSTIINGSLLKIDRKKATEVDLPTGCGYFVKELKNSNFITGTGKDPQKSNQLYVLFKNETVKIPLTQKGVGTKSSFLVLNDGTFLFAKDFELIHFDRNHVLNRIFVEKNITSIFQDSKDKIWIGLYNGGVICYPDNAISSKNAIAYLGANSVTSINEDFSNNIWVGTLNKGVFYLPEQQTVKYSAPQLFSDTGTNNQVLGIETTGISDTSSAYELRIISTQSSIYDSIPPTIYFSNLRIMNRDTAILKAYVLPYSQNFLNINFIGFSYKNPESIQYKYKMWGIDNTWTFTNNNSVQYTTLPPGEYKFVVSSMNKNGIWSENQASLQFTITPPFWETWWFLLTFISVIIVISSSVLYLWIRNIKERERAKSAIDKKIASAELQTLRAQMNPHFMFNTMSSIQHYITLNETESALRYLSKFSKLMRKILDNSKTPAITVKNEMETLELYLSLESLRFKNKLDYSFDIDKSIDQNYDEIPAMLIQPYVENAIIHGINHKEGKGTINVKLTRENDFIKCTITDDGVGRKRSAEINKSKNKRHTSSGMSITKERLNLLNEAQGQKTNVTITDLSDKESNATGTQIEIYILTEN